MHRPLFLFTVAGVLVAAASCGDPPPTSPLLFPGTGGEGGDVGATTSGSGDGGFDFSTSSAGGQAADGGGGMAMGGAAAMGCGDGIVQAGEACDDGNATPADGCAADCSSIENGFACPTPGMPCVSTVVCGDGKITGTETCDDQNTDPADGCSALCQVEMGWTCPKVGAACVAAMCGDGIIAGQEECEDDDAPPANGDGCSDNCVLEPGFKCDVPGQACVPTVCGDGLVEGSEQCDDANFDMGDGCTPECVNEPDCTLGACTTSCGDGIKLPGGNEQCEDGNTKNGDGCDSMCNVEPGYTCIDVSSTPTQLTLPIVLRDFPVSHPDMQYTTGTETGIVEAMLGANGKPQYNGNPTTATTTGQANFDQWYVDTPGINQTFLQSITLNQLPSGLFQFSDSSFFPLNGQGFGNQGNGNNFHFTSEVRYWFEYQGGETLNFTGDDDVWVFVNKQLAVDLGGVHGALSGGVDLDAQAGALGLQIGSIYEIVVFQAERHTTQSNYQLTLGNFVNATSDCQSICGDGIKTPDEVCDDGINDGMYGNCTVDCDYGPFCGDGMVQMPQEECDDGVNLTPYGGCAPGCQNGAFCGDGVVDSLFGEQCDDGTNDGGYGECGAGCVLGPRCGDGIVQMPEEQCDDGNTANGDGCDVNCDLDAPR